MNVLDIVKWPYIIFHFLSLSFFTLVSAPLCLPFSVPPPFRKVAYDTLKIEHQAHRAKTNDPLINKDADESLILGDDTATLSQAGVKNETTITFFKYDDYLEYKNNPTLVW